MSGSMTLFIGRRLPPAPRLHFPITDFRADEPTRMSPRSVYRRCLAAYKLFFHRLFFLSALLCINFLNKGADIHEKFWLFGNLRGSHLTDKNNFNFNVL